MKNTHRKVQIKQLGLVAYDEVLALQETLRQEIIQSKRSQQAEQPPLPHYLLFCEHPHVYTLGRGGNPDHLLINEASLQQYEATFCPTNRGGDITYHGPGQLVMYPILDLTHFFKDVDRYLRLLEDALMATLLDFGIASGRVPGRTGVWINHQDATTAKKIAAIGIHLRHWVTMHGIALNVNTDLDYFNHIVPCGIQDSGVTSMQQVLGKIILLAEVAAHLQRHMMRLFFMEAI